MLYQREIDDSVLIQFIILFTLYSCDAPIGYDDLLNLIMENCNISYFDFQPALNNLINTSHIRTIETDNDRLLYEITPKGLNTSDFFLHTVPVYIREPIQDSIKELFLEKRRKEAVRAQITPINLRDFKAECSLYDDDKMQLLELNIFAGSKEMARIMVDKFKSDYLNIYDKILRLMTEDENNNTDNDAKESDET